MNGDELIGWAALLGLVLFAAVMVDVPHSAIAPEPPPLDVAVTWERDAADGQPVTTCRAFRFADGREALKFAAFSEAIEPRGGVIAVHMGRACRPGEALQ